MEAGISDGEVARGGRKTFKEVGRNLEQPMKPEEPLVEHFDTEGADRAFLGSGLSLYIWTSEEGEEVIAFTVYANNTPEEDVWLEGMDGCGSLRLPYLSWSMAEGYAKTANSLLPQKVVAVLRQSRPPVQRGVPEQMAGFLIEKLLQWPQQCEMLPKPGQKNEVSARDREQQRRERWRRRFFHYAVLFRTQQPGGSRSHRPSYWTVEVGSGRCIRWDWPYADKDVVVAYSDQDSLDAWSTLVGCTQLSPDQAFPPITVSVANEAERRFFLDHGGKL